MTTPCDATLLKAIAAEKSPGKAFAELYARHADSVFRYGLIVSQCTAIAEDATQDTFVQMVDRASDYDAARSESALGWLYGLLRNNVRKLIRERAVEAHHTERQDVAPSTEYLCQLSDDVLELQSAIAQLNVEQREVLFLISLEGLNYEAASSVLGIPIGTVRSRLSRARQVLRSTMVDGGAINRVEVSHG